jgi:hypothetical protein
MSRIADKVAAAVPGAIVDFDVTEGGRAMGLEFLSSGKFFLINNGPYYPNYDIPIDWDETYSNIFVQQGQARTWITRTPLTFDKWIPSVVFLTHYFPDDPQQWQEVDVAVFAAAVANYEAAEPDPGKLKGGATLQLTLRRTPDVAGWAGEHRRAEQILVGFAAESENLLPEAARKLAEKKLDLICANPIGEAGVGFDAAENKIALLTRDGRTFHHARASKNEVAAWIWNQVESWARAQAHHESAAGER